MNDNSTAELKADVRAQLEWLAGNPRDMRAQDVRRRVQEMKAELEAHGETLEPERRTAPTRTESKIYSPSAACKAGRMDGRARTRLRCTRTVAMARRYAASRSRTGRTPRRACGGESCGCSTAPAR